MPIDYQNGVYEGFRYTDIKKPIYDLYHSSQSSTETNFSNFSNWEPVQVEVGDIWVDEPEPPKPVHCPFAALLAG